MLTATIALSVYSLIVTICAVIFYLEKSQLQGINESSINRMLSAEKRAVNFERLYREKSEEKILIANSTLGNHEKENC